MRYEHLASLEKKRLELEKTYDEYFEKPAAIGSDTPLASVHVTEIRRNLQVWEIETREIIVKLFGEESEEFYSYVAIGVDVNRKYNRDDPFYSWGSQETYIQSMFTLLIDLIDDLKRKGRSSKAKVFISFSSNDEKFVDELSRELRKLKKVEPTVIPIEARFGEKYRDLITEALDDAGTKFLLPMLSESGKRSLWVNQEIGYGVARNIQIVPVMEKHGGHGFITGDTVSILIKKNRADTIQEIVEYFREGG